VNWRPSTSPSSARATTRSPCCSHWSSSSPLHRRGWAVALSKDLARSGDHVSHGSHGDPGHLPDRVLIDVHAAQDRSRFTPGG